ncbi:purple acid phosphatase family protein [Leptolyngbya iicbica]|uniref:Metallophosphoesterase family protein n=2 Tax=Cyanophyceae TaxID=3028117 RepID=A0A4Q7EHF8_9CYAN|nr:metallophosphoesterase family protein [Leptolyngbya sp. LK]RZM83091.1 metallophosphoesterase family protein [Leptolyngbya sp. LK]
MTRRENLTLLISAIVLTVVALLVITLEAQVSFTTSSSGSPAMGRLLTDPFLQLPTATSVRVVWFTEFPGQTHTVYYGPRSGARLADNASTVPATTRLLSRLQEDQASNLPSGEALEAPAPRLVWRHEAEVTGLQPGQRWPYRVESVTDDGEILTSEEFTLSAAPAAGTPLKILLTSDHQAKPMTAANLQKVEETVGAVDAVFVAGDLVNVPDRASEWFDDATGAAFFPALQGRASYQLGNQEYRGGALIQSAPLFPAIGNHEVMGRVSPFTPLNKQFNDPVPRAAAVAVYDAQPELFNAQGDPALRQQWIVNHSFNTDTYEELFTLPMAEVPGRDRPTSQFYATTFGDVRLVSLFVTNIWRRPAVEIGVQGRFQERLADLGNPINWGHGQHIFEPIHAGSPQYQWLQSELASPEFQQARYQIVMLHHPPHSLGDNIVPPFTDPVPLYDRYPDGALRAVRYEYPKRDDYIMRDLMPLLESAGVDLVLYGHSHLWNRFVSESGMHFLETSNVGNTYGAFWQTEQRQMPPGEDTIEFNGYQQDYYVAQGDPNGLAPVMPTLAPLEDDSGSPLPYIASNDITAFSILETGSGKVTSYYFDTRQPNSDVVKFDEFILGQRG